MYWLSIWQKPNTDEIRLYINGTTRKSVYLKQSSDGKVQWSSKSNDTPAKFQTGNHYEKIRKDGEAAKAVAEAFGIKLGSASSQEDWDRALKMAQDGIQAEP